MAVVPISNMVGCFIAGKANPMGLVPNNGSVLLKGAALEAINLKSSDEKPSKDEAYYKTISLLDKIDSLEFTTHKGVGVGDEKRYQSDLVSGFELNFEKNLIHLSAINLENGK